MNIVIDTNIIFSALLSRNSRLRDFLLEEKNTMKLFSPHYVFVEIFKHKEKILKLSKLTEDEMYEFLNKILEKISFVNSGTVSERSKKEAYKLCDGIDLNDIPFVALTIELNGRLFSGDKKLKEGLAKKEFNKFFEL